MRSKGTMNFPKTSYQFLYSDPSIVEPQYLEGSKMEMVLYMSDFYAFFK